MYYSRLFKTSELEDFFSEYLLSKGFNVDRTVLCSAIPQYRVDIKFDQDIRDRLNDSEKELIRFFIPTFGKKDE